MNIRKLALQDIEAVSEVETCAQHDSWSKTMLQDIVTNDLWLCLLAEKDEKIVGDIILQLVDDTAEIHAITVTLTHRKQGIASALLKVCTDYLPANIKRILLEVRQGNQNAIALYNKMGFVPLGKRKNFYTNPKEDALIMEWSQPYANTRN